MADKISGETVYVTHREMSGVLWKIISSIVGACLALLTAGWSAQWSVSEKFERQSEAISSIKQDVAVIKVEVAQLSRTANLPRLNLDQAQYVLVQLPPGDAELKDIRVREILTKQGFIDGKTER